MNEIKIKLTIDNKEVAGSLALTDEQIQRIYSSAQTLAKSPVLQKFADDLLNIGEVSEEASQGIQEFIRYNQISDKQINEVINSLKQARSVLGLETAEYKQHSIAIENLTNAYMKLQPGIREHVSAINQGGKGLTGFNMLLGQTGFLLSDLDMMFVNTRLGLLSIGNNVSMVAQTFSIAVQQTKQFGMTFKEALLASLTPINLAVLAVNAFIFGLQMLARTSADTEKALDNQKKKVEELKNEYQRLTRAQLENRLAEAESSYQKTWGLFTSRKIFDPETGKASYVPTPDYLKPQAMIDAEKGIQMLKDSLFMLGQIDDINNRLAVNREKLNHLNEENFATLVEGAKTYEEAKTTLDAWIRSDEKSLRIEKEKSEAVKSISIQTDEQIKKELAILRVKLSQAESAREILAYIKAIVELERSLAEGSPSAQPETHSDEPPKAKSQGPLKEVPERYQKPAAVTETTEELEWQYGTLLLLNREWERLGQTMSAALARAIIRGESLNNVLQQMAEQLLQMSIQGLLGGLLSFFQPEVSFAQGFFGALGIRFAEGGVINEPIFGIGKSGTPYAFGEIGKELVLPITKYDSLIGALNGAMNSRSISHTVTVKVEGESTIRGQDLYTAWKKVYNIEKRYK
ncbi:MAG: hypothetical protein AB1775_03515 [Bacteroidota bacterium]